MHLVYRFLRWMTRMTCTHFGTTEYVITRYKAQKYALPHEVCEKMYCRKCGKVFYDRTGGAMYGDD